MSTSSTWSTSSTGDWLIDQKINLSQIGRECLFFFPAVTEELISAGIDSNDAQAYARFVRRATRWTAETNKLHTQLLSQDQYKRLSILARIPLPPTHLIRQRRKGATS